MATIRFRVTAADVAAAQRAQLLWRMRRPRFYVAPVGAGLLAVWVAVAGSEQPAAEDVLLALGMVVALYGALYALSFALLPGAARRQMKARAPLREEWTVEITEAGLVARTASVETRNAWSTYVAWSRNERVAIVYQSDQLMQFIPVRALTPEAEAIAMAQLAHLPRR